MAATRGLDLRGVAWPPPANGRARLAAANKKAARARAQGAAARAVGPDSMADLRVPNSASGQGPGGRRRSWAELLGRRERQAAGVGGAGPGTVSPVAQSLPAQPPPVRSREAAPGGFCGVGARLGRRGCLGPGSDPARTRPLLRLGRRPPALPAGRPLVSRTPPPPAALPEPGLWWAAWGSPRRRGRPSPAFPGSPDSGPPGPSSAASALAPFPLVSRHLRPGEEPRPLLGGCPWWVSPRRRARDPGCKRGGDGLEPTSLRSGKAQEAEIPS